MTEVRIPPYKIIQKNFHRQKQPTNPTRFPFFLFLHHMKVTGFTFIKNAILFDYPIEEAIRSILPLCQNIIVAVGNSSDDTRQLIAAIDPEKITIIDTIWDDSLREGGQVLADETNKAFQAIPPDTDWCIYIQGDEVIHEKYHAPIHQSMQQWLHHPEVDGLLFDYLHFYGTYDYVGVASRWYRHEIRIIRNHKSIYSYRDAQGFRKGNNQKLQVKNAYATMYHYGWVKKPVTQLLKRENFGQLWSGTTSPSPQLIRPEGSFDYSNIDALKPFTGTHPAVMQARIQAQNWAFSHPLSKNRLTLKEAAKQLLLKLGINTYYRNYKRI